MPNKKSPPKSAKQEKQQKRKIQHGKGLFNSFKSKASLSLSDKASEDVRSKNILESAKSTAERLKCAVDNEIFEKCLPCVKYHKEYVGNDPKQSRQKFLLATADKYATALNQETNHYELYKDVAKLLRAIQNKRLMPNAMPLIDPELLDSTAMRINQFLTNNRGQMRASTAAAQPNQPFAVQQPNQRSAPSPLMANRPVNLLPRSTNPPTNRPEPTINNVTQDMIALQNHFKQRLAAVENKVNQMNQARPPRNPQNAPFAGFKQQTARPSRANAGVFNRQQRNSIPSAVNASPSQRRNASTNMRNV
jgi:hypothetical protein